MKMAVKTSWHKPPLWLRIYIEALFWSFEFFDRMHDPELSDDEVFKSKLEFQLQDMTCVVGYGGIHGALPNYVEVSEERET